jgi:colanic acid biosynthesis glycosyl transferase WcaI
MKIVVNDYSGHPFQVELSRELAARGHSVLHLFSSDFQSPKGDLLRRQDDPATFEVVGLSLGTPFQKYDFMKRRGQEIAYAGLVCRRLEAFEPDLVVGCNNPLDAQRRIQDHCRCHGISFVFWLQDIYSNAIRSILARRLGIVGNMIGARYQALERRLLVRSDHVVAISDDFLPQLAAWRLDKRRVSVIENWAARNDAAPRERGNAWRRENGLCNKKVALYTGTIGLKHNPDLLLQAAAGLRNDPEVMLVVVSEGSFADYVAASAASAGLSNVVVKPFQSHCRYAETLAVAAIHLGLQERLYLGNLDAKRDWGHARDYVRGMWLMLRQSEPDDYVLATGETHGVRSFVEKAFRRVGIDLEWREQGIDETGVDADGRTLIEIDPRYFRPTEVDRLLGDPRKAREKLGWCHEPSLDGSHRRNDPRRSQSDGARGAAAVAGQGASYSMSNDPQTRTCCPTSASGVAGRNRLLGGAVAPPHVRPKRASM